MSLALIMIPPLICSTLFLRMHVELRSLELFAYGIFFCLSFHVILLSAVLYIRFRSISASCLIRMSAVMLLQGRM